MECILMYVEGDLEYEYVEWMSEYVDKYIVAWEYWIKLWSINKENTTKKQPRELWSLWLWKRLEMFRCWF